jgi:hypothetical protein
MCDRIAVHNELSPIISKIELLTSLAPVLDDDRDLIQCLHTINDMVADYARELRRTLDAIAEGDRP